MVVGTPFLLYSSKGVQDEWRRGRRNRQVLECSHAPRDASLRMRNPLRTFENYLKMPVHKPPPISRGPPHRSHFCTLTTPRSRPYFTRRYHSVSLAARTTPRHKFSVLIRRAGIAQKWLKALASRLRSANCSTSSSVSLRILVIVYIASDASFRRHLLQQQGDLPPRNHLQCL